MDLRTIMNTDGGASNPPPNNSASSPISDQTPQKRPKKAASYSEYPTRPPQPPLQHPQHVSPERSSPYASVQSPYQQFNSGPPINTAVRSQRSQTPPHVSTSYGPGTRDPFGAQAYGSHPQHPGGPLVSPYTPQPIAFPTAFSITSICDDSTPSSDRIFPQPSCCIATSSLATYYIPALLSHCTPICSRHPLGPPPTFATRQSPSTARPPSSGHDSPGNPLSSPRPTQEAPIRDQVPTQSPVTQRQFSPHSSQPSESTHLPSGGLKQETTESASPQSISRHNSIVTVSESATAGQTRSSEDRMLAESPTTQKPTADSLASPLAPGRQMNSSPSGARGGAHAMDMEVDHEPRVDEQQPKQKKKESQQDPSWAARRRSTSTMAVTPAATRVTRAPAVASPSTSMPRVQAPPVPPAPSLRPPSTSQTVGSLGPWEPSITGFIPHEEITKTLCDFLFQHVVMRNDVTAGSTGSAAGQGTIVEIEAKLGHIIDMDSRDRINLPILTESVLNRENSRFRTSFESNMTVEQHRAMNNFLNEAVKASMPQPNSTRIPLAYVHKKERDTFYEIQASDLPPVIRQNLNPRHKPKVRVTTDERTGEILAKIVKCRVADVDVCSPRTTVDWRVSVNLEMEYTGDVSNLPVIDTAVIKGGRGDRIKDRMSYRHLAYQVDLTQVAKSDQQPGKHEFDHELEVEVSAEEIRRQGQLAMSGDPKNQYEDLVKGFVDNIRLLARAVPP
ncbi:hypothetical protein N7491_002479 [Penicillium cf. griseofulvum]|nr:hypothetical protein N7491_002479 [Penicillium cf. griseofulvum]